MRRVGTRPRCAQRAYRRLVALPDGCRIRSDAHLGGSGHSQYSGARQLNRHRSDGGGESRKSYGRGVPNTSERMHSFWLSQLEEAAEGLRTDADEWSASLVQRARGYARLGPMPHVGVEYERLEAL